MKKKIGDLTINELLIFLKETCKKAHCGDCPFQHALCGEFEYSLKNLIEDVGENTLIEVEDE